jgi:microcompartment protein CcmL/EutN
MNQALAMIELNTVAAGVRALDAITKTAAVEILTAQTVCPGKYMIIFYGALSAVKASLDTAREAQPAREIDSFLLGSPAESLIAAIYGTFYENDENGGGGKQGKSVGLIETFSGPAAVLAADTAVKTARVVLTEIRLSRGMCGKSYAMFTGGLAEVEEATEAARKAAAENGMLLDIAVIANPDEKMRRFL